MKNESSENEWNRSDTTDESASMTARSDLQLALQRTIGEWGLTQEAAGERLGITRQRINDLLTGKISKFSLDALVDLAARAGMVIEIHTIRPT